MNDIFNLELENGLTPFLNNCKYDNLLPELINTLEYVPFICYEVDLNENNCLIYSCKYNSNKITNELLKLCNLNLNLFNKNGICCFTFAAYYNNIELCDKLISKGFLVNNLFIKDKYNKIPIEYLSEENYNKYYIKYHMYGGFNLKLYELSDLNIIDNNFSEGSFGNLIKSIEKKTLNNLIIKEYNMCNKNSKKYISQDILKEIFFLKKINEIDENIAVKIYGILYHNNCICIVMEELSQTLYEYIFEYKKTSIDLKDFYKNIFKRIIILINNLHSIGICHCDIKSDNIMIDSKGFLKLIDFGYSTFMGIGLSENIYLNDDYYNQFPDFINNFIINIDGKEIEIIKNLENFKGNITRKSFNNDIYYIGNMFIDIIIGKEKADKYFIYNNIIYSSKLSEYNFNKITKADFELLNENLYLVDLLKKIMNINSYERLLCKEILNEKYFTDLNTNLKIILNTSNNFNNYFFYDNKLITKYYNYYYKYTENEISNNSYELLYLNEIKNIYSNEKIIYKEISKIILNLENFNIILEILHFFMNDNIDISFDAILNLIILSKLNETINIYYYGYIFQTFYNLTTYSSTYKKLNNEMLKNILFNKINFNINILDCNINIYQFMIHINYICITSLIENKKELCCYLMENIFKIIICSDIYDFIIFDLIEYLYKKFIKSNIINIYFDKIIEDSNLIFIEYLKYPNFKYIFT